MMITQHYGTPSSVRAALIAVAAAGVALVGCNNFLSSPDAINNPNNATSASTAQSITAVETNVTELQSGDPARLITMWMQQFSGSQGQYTSDAKYALTEDFSDGYWSTVYEGGGLQDLRTAEDKADAAGDSVTAGIARVLEAYDIGTAADWWGDIPYSQALTIGTPAPLDKQLDVYAEVQKVLDRAIVQLGTKQGTGPSAGDLYYGGDPTAWIAAANTLKARFYLHTAEQKGTAPDGSPAFDPAAYQNALAAANKGIASPDGNLRTYQSTNPTEQNLWYQFTVLARAGYIAPSAYFVNLLKARNDPRLTVYFTPGDTNQIVGTPNINGLPAYVASLNNASGSPGAPDYQEPLLTYSETQFIIAEAQYRLGNTGAALTALNNARAVTKLPALSALPADGLNEIMTEKYITLFQSPETWSDYRRTCLPVRTPAPGAAAGIPARFTYPLNERNTNPNIPSVTDQPPRNANDPNPCFVNGTQTSR